MSPSLPCDMVLLVFSFMAMPLSLLRSLLKISRLDRPSVLESAAVDGPCVGNA